MPKKASDLTIIEKWTKFLNGASYHRMVTRVENSLVYSLVHEYSGVKPLKVIFENYCGVIWTV